MLAGFLMAPVLTVISRLRGILGGWVVARFTLQVNSGLLLVVGGPKAFTWKTRGWA
jgi:ABC-type transporter Mla maintaining outer membrane lipid asymmetry permease subunit MlaE